jgi:MFS family permease
MKSRELLPYQIVLGVVTGSIAGIIAILGELRDTFGFSEAAIGVIVAFGFLASFIAQAGFARFADRGFGRQMATIGIAMSAVALLIMVVADSVLVWTLSRAILGFAGGLVVPGLRRAASVLDPERAGENLGRLVLGDVVGFVLGPVVAAGLAEVGGIRAPFLVFAVASVLFLPFVMRLPDDRGEKDATAGLPLDLLKIRRLQGALILVFGYFVLIGAFESVLPVMFEDMGASSLVTGVAFTLFALPILFISARAGRTADRIGPPTVAIAGMALSAVGAVSYGSVGAIWLLIVMMVVTGFADGYGYIASQVMVSRAVPEARQAGALGLMGAAGVLGAGVSAFPAAWIYGEVGRQLAWFYIGAIALIILALGTVRLRNTEPQNSSIPT